MTYKITYFNKWINPYSGNVTNKSMCRHIMSDIYEVNDLDTCKDVINDLLDPPASEMTLENARKEFEDLRIGPLSNDTLMSICNYYNGRRELYIKILNDLDKIEIGSKYVLQIPFEYNFFECYHNDSDVYVQEGAYIEIEITSNDPVELK